MPEPGDMLALIAAGERAAFHGPPLGGVPPLRRALMLAAEPGLRARAAWLLGVCLGAAGRYGQAQDALAPVIGDQAVATGSTRAMHRSYAGLCAAALASHRRQLGDHAAGRDYDLLARTIAAGDRPAEFDAALGLAADAVGLGDPGGASTELAAAERLLAVGDWGPTGDGGQDGRVADDEARDPRWRQRVRLHWVRAEVALLTDDPGQACGHAGAAIEASRVNDAPRHLAKSLLFQGAALAVVAQHAGIPPDTALRSLDQAARLARELGTLPLAWPTEALLASLLEPADAARARAHRDAAARAIRTISADLPEPDAAAWMSRPDISAILSPHHPSG